MAVVGARPDIRLDMFEVGLGAAVLLQLRPNAGESVVLLADAGIVQTGGRKLDHVHRKLDEPLSAFGSQRRIDLMIGTHYDRDHLAGLVPIIQDESIEIGEAWMPPVANDTDLSEEDAPLTEEAMLGYQFATRGEEGVREYMHAKLDQCEALARIEDSLMAPEGEREYRDRAERRITRPDTIEQLREALRGHARSSEDAEQDNDEASIVGPPMDISSRPRSYGVPKYKIQRLLESPPEGPPLSVLGGAEINPVSATRSIRAIRESTAKEGITADSLAKVVQALEARKIKTKYRHIQDGAPISFGWEHSQRRFIPVASTRSLDPVLTLLGPSGGLIEKHWHRLPLLNYATFAVERLIPIKYITPSNQLSYVVRVESADTAVLVTGDAGMVDFTGDDKLFHPRLIEGLANLDVVQVAHHAGHNAYFYRAMLASTKEARTETQYYLISHAPDDEFRPSPEFGQYLADPRLSGSALELLFTSVPRKGFVDDYDGLIGPVVGSPGEVGDITLEHGDGHWTVRRHAVHVS